MNKKYAWLLLGSLFSLVPSYSSGEIIYGTTVFRELISFDSATPGTISTPIPITGLFDQFESIAGIDFRPATGALYAWGNAPGSNYRLYTLDTTTGVATQVPGNVGLNQPLGNSWGFDFNPAADRIRIVNNEEFSYRFHPDTGALVATDTSISPPGNVAAAAYDRNDTNPLTLTTLFAIDSAAGTLARIGGIDGSPSPNLGALTTIGSLGLGTNLAGQASFDISQTGIAYAALSPSFGASPSLYTINLNTGAASLLGTIGDGSLQGLTGMSAFISAVPEPSSVMLLGVGLLIGAVRRRR